MKTKFLQATAALVGTAIGAGILGIPYAILQSGVLVGLGYLFLLAGVVLVLNLMYGEAILRTDGDHQLAGYAKIYLGTGGEVAATIATFVGIYGALLAYIIKGGEFLGFIFGADPFIFSLLFAALGSLLVLIGLNILSDVEIFLTFGIVCLVILLVAVAHSSISIANYFPLAVNNLHFLLLPYGVILFALHGASVLPEVEEILRSDHHLLKKAIFFGTLTPAVLYLIFALTVLGISGSFTSDDAFTGLVSFLPDWVSIAGALLAVLAMGTSFLTLGYVLRETYYRDWGMDKRAAWALACLLPVVLYFLSSQNFIQVLGTTGAITGSLTGIIVIALYNQARKKGQKEPEYRLHVPRSLQFLLAFLLSAGALLTIFL